VARFGGALQSDGDPRGVDGHLPIYPLCSSLPSYMSASPSCRQRKLIPLSQVGQYLGWRIESETGLGSIFSGDLDLGYRTQRDKGLS
jgi:hypothetical protein